MVLWAHLSLRAVTRLIAVRAPESRLTSGVVAVPGHYPTRTTTPTARSGAVSHTRQVVPPPAYIQIKITIGYILGKSWLQ